VRQYREAVRVDPNYAEAYYNLALTLKDQEQVDEAIATYREALRIRPDFFEARFNLGSLLRRQGLVPEALEAFEIAVGQHPDHTEAHYRLGLCYYNDNQLDKAMECWRRAMDLQPEYPEARRNRALVWLRQGKYEQGWAEWEHRFGCPELVTRACSEPRWDGTPLSGRTLLLHTEQGLGDTLQFMRYVEPARKLADSLKIEVQASLVPLLAASGYGPLLVPQKTPTACDVQCPLLSVPYTLASRGSEPYWNGPYLAPSADLVASWEPRVRTTRDLQVGIAWAGNPGHTYDRFRSVRLAEFLPLARMTGVRLISLQKGAEATQLADLPADARVVDFGDSFDSANGAFMDTAAVIKNLDLVIAVDTSIAHLAGGMGMPVWVLLQFSPDWRWRLDGHETPWYPSMRLFRQQRPHDWGQVFRDVAEQLGALVANRPS
jgi:Tetratricopeptide repeat